MTLPTLTEIDAELAGRRNTNAFTQCSRGHTWIGLRQTCLVCDASYHHAEELIQIAKALTIAADPDDLPALTRLAAKLEPTLRRAFLAAVAETRGEIDAEALAVALASGQYSRAEELIEIDKLATRLNGTVGPILRQGFLEGAGVAQTALTAVGLAPRFDLVNPYAVVWAAREGARLVVDITEPTREAIRTLIRDSVAGGEDVRATARALRDVVGLDPRRALAVEAFRARLADDGVDAAKVAARTERYAAAQVRQRATVISRTEILTAENQGQEALWRVAVEQGLLDPGSTRRTWIVTDDDRLDAECEALDGEEAELGGTFPGGYSGPPAHPQCFPGFVPVSGQICAGTRMLYAGETREIVTASGRTLTVTPNHPIATTRGMCPAEQIQKGDYLLAYGNGIEGLDPLARPSVRDFASPQDKQNGPVRIEQVFQTLRCRAVSCTRERFGFEFHGDAARGQGEIDIVLFNRELPAPVHIDTPEDRQNFTFMSAGPTTEARGSKGSGNVATMSGRVALTTPIIRSANRTRSKPTQVLRIGSTSRLDAAIQEAGGQKITREAAFARELQERLPGLVLQDQVIKVRRSWFYGHVYDLQTVSGLIVACGLLVSNCRCSEGLVFKND